MKVLFLVLALGAVAHGFLVKQTPQEYANYRHGQQHQTEIEREGQGHESFQVDILKLLQNIFNINFHRQQHMIGDQYVLEDNIEHYHDSDAVMDYVKRYRTGEGFLKHNQVFNIVVGKHRRELVTLFKVFVGAKNIEEFYKVSCWARTHVNPGVFMKAFTSALLHRPDTQHIVIPPMYQTNPYSFFRHPAIHRAQVVKTQGVLFNKEEARNMGVEQVDAHTYIINAEYTGENVDNDAEYKINYFTEDIGLNNNYYFLHAYRPFWVDYEDIEVHRRNDDRRGEIYLYNHQQLLARYYMERLSNDLGEIPRLEYEHPIETGYNPSIVYYNGVAAPSRPNNFIVNTADNFWDLTSVLDYERRIRDAVERGFLYTDEGKQISMSKPEDIVRLGNVIQANTESPNRYYFKQGFLVAKKLLGNRRGIDDEFGRTPSTLEQYETTLRDPVFYQLTQRIMHNVLKFKHNLPPYTKEEVSFEDIKIEDFHVDKLITYCDNFDVDVTNALYNKVEEVVKAHHDDDTKIIIRQERLNHAPFNVRLGVSSHKNIEAVVRIFMGPKYDSDGNHIEFKNNMYNFVQLDEFMYDLKSGSNDIVRHSREFRFVKDDNVPSQTVYDEVVRNIEHHSDKEFTYKNVLLPNRLLLPKGKINGMKFQLFVSVTPIKAAMEHSQYMRNGIYEALGYPLDRKIENTHQFLSLPNFLLTDVVIYHEKREHGNHHHHEGNYEHNELALNPEYQRTYHNYNPKTIQYDSERYPQYTRSMYPNIHSFGKTGYMNQYKYPNVYKYTHDYQKMYPTEMSGFMNTFPQYPENVYKYTHQYKYPNTGKTQFYDSLVQNPEFFKYSHNYPSMYHTQSSDYTSQYPENLYQHNYNNKHQHQYPENMYQYIQSYKYPMQYAQSHKYPTQYLQNIYSQYTQDYKYPTQYSQHTQDYKYPTQYSQYTQDYKYPTQYSQYTKDYKYPTQYSQYTKDYKYPTQYSQYTKDYKYPTQYSQYTKDYKYPTQYSQYTMDNKYPTQYSQYTQDNKYPTGFLSHYQYPQNIYQYSHNMDSKYPHTQSYGKTGFFNHHEQYPENTYSHNYEHKYPQMQSYEKTGFMSHHEQYPEKTYSHHAQQYPENTYSHHYPQIQSYEKTGFLNHHEQYPENTYSHQYEQKYPHTQSYEKTGYMNHHEQYPENTYSHHGQQYTENTYSQKYPSHFYNQQKHQTDLTV